MDKQNGEVRHDLDYNSTAFCNEKETKTHIYIKNKVSMSVMVQKLKHG